MHTQVSAGTFNAIMDGPLRCEHPRVCLPLPDQLTGPICARQGSSVAVTSSCFAPFLEDAFSLGNLTRLLPRYLPRNVPAQFGP